MIKKLCMLPLILLPSMPLIAAELTVDISGINEDEEVYEKVINNVAILGKLN